MPVTIPFLPSDTNYRLAVPINDFQLMFDVRWNSRDEAFYLDIYEPDDTVVALNVKVIVGVPLARWSKHEFFDTHVLTAVDTSNEGRDPGYDDLGTRVQLVVQTPEDLS